MELNSWIVMMWRKIDSGLSVLKLVVQKRCDIYRVGGGMRKVSKWLYVK